LRGRCSSVYPVGVSMGVMYSQFKERASTFVFAYHRAMEKQKRPPGDRGQGRKPLVVGMETVPFVVRVTTDQRDKLLRLGGAKWLRERIDKAKEPSR
jgi:hypothetical protein